MIGMKNEQEAQHSKGNVMKKKRSSSYLIELAHGIEIL